MVAVDSYAPLTSGVPPETTFSFDTAPLTEAGHDISPEELFEAMARLDHPDAEAVLNLIGRHCDNKKTAKAARKASVKAASHRAARRS